MRIYLYYNFCTVFSILFVYYTKKEMRGNIFLSIKLNELIFCHSFDLYLNENWNAMKINVPVTVASCMLQWNYWYWAVEITNNKTCLKIHEERITIKSRPDACFEVRRIGFRNIFLNFASIITIFQQLCVKYCKELGTTQVF